MAAAQLEGWCLALGRRSVAVLALVLGRLCALYGVDPAHAATVVRAAAEEAS